MRMYQYDKNLDFHALGREIKRKREAKGWTQEYLAQLVDRNPALHHVYGKSGAEAKSQCFLPACHPAGDFRGSIHFPGQAQRREHLPETDRCHAQFDGRKRANRNEIHSRGTAKSPGNGGCVKRSTRLRFLRHFRGLHKTASNSGVATLRNFCRAQGP